MESIQNQDRLFHCAALLKMLCTDNIIIYKKWILGTEVDEYVNGRSSREDEAMWPAKFFLQVKIENGMMELI